MESKPEVMITFAGLFFLPFFHFMQGNQIFSRKTYNIIHIMLPGPLQHNNIPIKPVLLDFLKNSMTYAPCGRVLKNARMPVCAFQHSI